MEMILRMKLQNAKGEKTIVTQRGQDTYFKEEIGA